MNKIIGLTIAFVLTIVGFSSAVYAQTATPTPTTMMASPTPTTTVPMAAPATGFGN